MAPLLGNPAFECKCLNCAVDAFAQLWIMKNLDTNNNKNCSTRIDSVGITESQN